MSEEINRCKCGGSASVRRSGLNTWVACRVCGLSGPVTVLPRSTYHIKSWNSEHPSLP